MWNLGKTAVMKMESSVCPELKRFEIRLKTIVELNREKANRFPILATDKCNIKPLIITIC